MQTLRRVETCTAGDWTLDITRDDVDGATRGYIVSAHNGARSVTLHTIGVSYGYPGSRSASVAFASALRYLATAKAGIEATGYLPCYAPRPKQYYSD